MDYSLPNLRDNACVSGAQAFHVSHRPMPKRIRPAVFSFPHSHMVTGSVYSSHLEECKDNARTTPHPALDLLQLTTMRIFRRLRDVLVTPIMSRRSIGTQHF
ncbi:uncharacterized protein [Penaeus vannamei]|uniref:uncharacterized protein n=1 Tax=Penaeus vannamei TaxID=6689 RepID=UPI00387F637D